jgi:hypothetical protein
MSVEIEPTSGVGTYAEYLKDQLAAEEKRKASLEQRGLAVISSAGALVTLLFALSALATKAQPTFVLEQGSKTLLFAAVAVFLLCAVAALATNLPVPYKNVSPAAVKRRLRETPLRDDEQATRDIALTSVNVLSDAKAKNQAKALVLFAALGLEVIAVALVAVAMGTVIL